jgi:phage gp29-like protein
MANANIVEVKPRPKKSPPDAVLFSKQAAIHTTERFATGYSYGELNPLTLSGILQECETGWLKQWSELCEYALETDEQLGDAVGTRITRAAQAPWSIVAGNAHNARAQEQAEPAMRFVRDVLDGIPTFDTDLASILQAIGNGVSAHQFQWNYLRGMMVITGLDWAHPRRFKWDADYKLRLYDYGRRGGGGEGEELIKDLWLVHVSKERPSYPTRAGVIRSTIWAWLFKRWVNRYWIHATEKFGQPGVHAVTPANSSPAVRRKTLEALENLSYDSVAVFEEGVEIVYQGGPGTAANGDMFEKYLRYADENMSKAILGATDITDPGTHGSQSAVETRVEAVLDPRTVTDAMNLANTLREQMFKPLILHNLHLFNGVIPPIPRMVHGGDAAQEAEPVPEVSVDPAGEREKQKDGRAAEMAPDGQQAPRPAAQTPEDIEAVDPEAALNGAQVTALLDIVGQVGAGTIPRPTAVEIMVAAFPIDRETADRILGDVGQGFTPAPEVEASRKKKRLNSAEAEPVVLTRGSSESGPINTDSSMSPLKKALIGE